MDVLTPQSRAPLSFAREWFRQRGRVVDDATIIRSALDAFAASLRNVDVTVRASTPVQEPDDDGPEDDSSERWSL